MPEDPAHRRGVEHRRLVQVHAALVEAPPHRDVVHVQHLGPLVEQHALRQPGGAARVHEHDRVVLLGLLGHDRLPRREQVLVADVVGHVALADQHHLLDARLRAHGVDERRERGVREADPRPRVAEDELELLGREPKVERVDHPGAEERGVVQLEELVAVERHHREALVAADAELAAQPVREPQHPIDVLAIGRLVRPVEERRLVGQALGGRQQLPVVDELLHAVPPCRHLRSSHAGGPRNKPAEPVRRLETQLPRDHDRDSRLRRSHSLSLARSIVVGQSSVATRVGAALLAAPSRRREKFAFNGCCHVEALWKRQTAAERSSCVRQIARRAV